MKTNTTESKHQLVERLRTVTTPITEIISPTEGEWFVENIMCGGPRIVSGIQDAETGYRDDVPLTPTPEGQANAKIMAASKDLLKACKAQHKAIDILFALLIEKDPNFSPTRSGHPWTALIQGNDAISKAELKTTQQL